MKNNFQNVILNLTLQFFHKNVTSRDVTIQIFVLKKNNGYLNTVEQHT